MKRKLFYTKYAITSFRIIAYICILLLVTVEIANTFSGQSILNIVKKKPIDFYTLCFRVFNIISIILFIIISIFPQKICIFSFITFFYAFSIVPFEPENYMGLLMYVLGTSALLARGVMKKNKKLKLIILSLIYFVLLLTHLRFGVSNFINYFLINIGGILVLALFTFFIHCYYVNTIVYEDKKLNIAEYPELNERDCIILQQIQNKQKYSTIANSVGLSEGALKNRLHFVFDTLETGDKQGFMSIYDDWEILFNPQYVHTEDSYNN